MLPGSSINTDRCHHKTDSAFHGLQQFIKKHRKRLIVARCADAGILMLSLFLILGTALSLVFILVPLIALPMIFIGVALITLVLWILYTVYNVFINPPSLTNVARMLEARNPECHQYLSIGLELEQCATSTIGAGCIARVWGRAIASLHEYPAMIQPFFKAKTVYLLPSSVFLFASVALLGSPKLVSYCTVPGLFFTGADMTVTPRSITVPFHASVCLTAYDNGKRYPSCRISVWHDGLEKKSAYTKLLVPDTDNVFRYTRDSCTASFYYSFSYGGRSIGPETITVVPAPTLYILNVTLTPPRYTGLSSTHLPPGTGSFSAYQGTVAHFKIGSRSPLRNASLVFNKRDTTSLITDHDRAQGSLPVTGNGTYTFLLQDHLGQRSDSTPTFSISVLPDLMPSVSIVKPGMNKALDQTQAETLCIYAQDDFSIADVSLRWRKSTDPAVHAASFTIPDTVKSTIQILHAWDLRPMRLYPGDTLFYWATASDMPVNHRTRPQSTDTFHFRVPTFEEISQAIIHDQDLARQTVSSVQKMQEAVKDKLHTMMQQGNTHQPLSWEDRRTLDDMEDHVHAQADSLDKAVEELRDAAARMKNNSMAPDIIDKIAAIQKNVQALAQKYGDSLFFQPPHDNDRLTMNDIWQSLETMAKKMPDLDKQLDNTLKYLEWLEKEMQISLLAQQARQLAQQQQRLAQQHGTTPSAVQKQDTLNEKMARFSETAREQLNDGTSTRSAISLDSVSMNLATLKSFSRRSMSPALQAMNRMSQSLQSVASQMEATLQSKRMAALERTRTLLTSLGLDMLALGEWQDQIGDLNPSSGSKNVPAAHEQALSETFDRRARLLDSMEGLPLPMLQALVRKIDSTRTVLGRTAESFAAHTSPGGRTHDPSLHLQDLAHSLLGMAQKMKNGQDGQGQGMSGLMTGLEKLSSKQAALNTLTFQLLSRMLNAPSSPQPGEGNGTGTEAAFEEAQKKQKEITDQLRSLREKYGDKNNDIGRQIKELEQEARTLEQWYENPTPQLPERQDRFLARLLQAAVSIHKQEESSEERTATSAHTPFEKRHVNDIDSSAAGIDMFYRLRLQALSANIPESYRKQVQAYFEYLGELYLKEK